MNPVTGSTCCGCFTAFRHYFTILIPRQTPLASHLTLGQSTYVIHQGARTHYQLVLGFRPFRLPPVGLFADPILQIPFVAAATAASSTVEAPSTVHAFSNYPLPVAALLRRGSNRNIGQC